MIPVGVAVLLVLLTAVLWEYRAFTGLSSTRTPTVRK